MNYEAGCPTSSEPGNMLTWFDPLLFGHDVMATLISLLNFHLQSIKDGSGDRGSIYTYQEVLSLYDDLSRKKHRSASEESDLSVYNFHLAIAEERYIQDLAERLSLFKELLGQDLSMLRDEMRSYFSNTQRSVGRNAVAHPYSTAIESLKIKRHNDGYVFYELHDSLTARGKDPDVNRWLLDGLDKLEELSNSNKLPEFLSKSKTCFSMQLRFLKSILTLESKPPGAWVTIVKKGRRPVKTTHKASGWNLQSGL